MADWTKDLEGWDEFVKHAREETLTKMAPSAMVMSIVPDEEKFDVKFALELGMAIMLGKPLIAIVMPGAEIPPKLRLVADEIVVADLDLEAGRGAVAEAVRRLVPHLMEEDE